MALIQSNFYSQKLKKNVNVIVFIPTVSADDYLGDNTYPDYYSKEGKFQTLYLLHGSYGDCTDWTRLSSVLRYAQEYCLAVVMPSGENSSYVNMEHGEAYLEYITEELPEFMEKIFPLSNKRSDRFIAGLSMGGYGAFRCAFEKPENYDTAISLSGALNMEMLYRGSEAHTRKMPAHYKTAVFKDCLSIQGTENDLIYKLKKILEQKKEIPKLLMICGTEDFIRPTNEEFYKEVSDLPVNLCYRRKPGIHDWDFWDEHIKEAIAYLNLKRNLIV